MKIKKFDSINVIPFIDVLLVLLAIVLMTSTFITKGMIPINLPNANSAQSLKLNKEVIIIIKDDEQLYCNNNITNIKDIIRHILQFKKTTPIYIKSDKSVKFNTFVKVLDMLKTNGFNNISIVTKNE